MTMEYQMGCFNFAAKSLFFWEILQKKSKCYYVAVILTVYKNDSSTLFCLWINTIGKVVIIF